MTQLFFAGLEFDDKLRVYEYNCTNQKDGTLFFRIQTTLVLEPKIARRFILYTTTWQKPQWLVGFFYLDEIVGGEAGAHVSPGQRQLTTLPTTLDSKA